MMEYVLAYMAGHGLYASSMEEEKVIEDGIAKYLLEHGIDLGGKGAYFENYLLSHLNSISPSDLKSYFIHYEAISTVRQIVMEYSYDYILPVLRKEKLIHCLEELYACGLGEKYIPAIEVGEILQL